MEVSQWTVIIHHQFDKIYIVPCVKTLNCQYFKNIFINILLNEDLVVFEKFVKSVWKHYTWNVLTTLYVLHVNQSKISITLHIQSGFLICQYPKDIRYNFFMNSMIFMVVFKCS
jgi:hypothetical protein